MWLRFAWHSWLFRLIPNLLFAGRDVVLVLQLRVHINTRPYARCHATKSGHNARNAALCPVSLTRFIRAYLGVTVGSGHTMVVLYEYINYSFPSSRRITTLGASLTRRCGVRSPSER
eukprot:COSAG02_NODE_14237_length_1294_cov_6.015063_3_plen_117_part_00